MNKWIIKFPVEPKGAVGSCRLIVPALITGILLLALPVTAASETDLNGDDKVDIPLAQSDHRRGGYLAYEWAYHCLASFFR